MEKESTGSRLLGGVTDGVVGGIGGAVSSGIGGLVNEVFGINKKNAQRQRDMMSYGASLNHKYGEEAAEAAFQRQKEMYERSYQDQSYQNKVQQMKDAGLSIGLMMSGGAAGQGGGAGSTSQQAQGGGAGGQQGRVSTAAEEQQAMNQSLAMGLQMQKTRAEIDVLKADAEQKRADATKKSGVDTQLAETNITKALEEIESTRVKREGQQLQNQYDQVRNEIQNATKDDQIGAIKVGVDKLNTEWEILDEQLAQEMNRTDISDETVDTIIKTQKQQLANLTAETVVKYAQADNIKRDTQAIGQQIGIDIANGKINAGNLQARIMEAGINMKSEQGRQLVSILTSIIGGASTLAGASILRGRTAPMLTNTTERSVTVPMKGGGSVRTTTRGNEYK